MLTIFTTTKDFIGSNKVNQLNAIRSWLKAPYAIEVLVFGESEGLNEVIKDYQLKHIPNIKTSQSGVPLVSEMFIEASKYASYNMLCFLNADIILTSSFFYDIQTIHKKTHKNYLIIGQRLDVDVNKELKFDKNWEAQFFDDYKSNIKVHPPYGSDFFVFPIHQYNSDNIPPLLVGRPGWDLWMIYNARKRHLKTIDLSFSTKVIHQNHDYSHKISDSKKRREDDEFNYQYFKEDEKYIFLLESCNYCFTDGKLKRNFAKGNLNNFLLLESKIYGEESIHFLKARILAKLVKTLKKIFKSN
ncbi:hypothetical protein [Xanthocytophaga agilis]|uniref:Uncharacterized protein n=1 Tax=Xanthocytophaga agilis TaxID=3048010 RepID=A0AAE3R676_9BACT|nr:hypothetical protein [Xanthocytophaga agilis]MDJ1502179.1 hypothetical protein [Xanthocytophaga agilis]